MAEVDTVVFDIGRVLVRWNLRHLYAKLIDDPAELDWFVTHVVTEAWHFEHDAGRDLQEMVTEKRRAFPDHAHLVEAYATRFHETIPGPVPGTAALVERLDAAGVPLYAITNFAAAFWGPFRADWPVLAHFRDTVVSGQEKMAKPDPAIFELAARRFAIDPAHTLFIDDNPANIAAARDCGWQTHLFIDAAALEGDLADRGLLT